MTIEPHGEIKTTLPATTKGAYGEVREIHVWPKATATGIVSVQCGGVTVKQFNTPSATGQLDEPYKIPGPVEPTQFAIVPDAGSNGAWVTYFVE